MIDQEVKLPEQRKETENKPVISVITVVYNRVHEIERTVQSIINQTYDRIQYIIIDGGSTDGTVDILKKYENKIAYWISEPDKGIYDAMNKGIERATGDYVNFMNCGDRFASEDVIQTFVKGQYEADIVYGEALVEYKSYSALFKRSPLKNMWRHSPFCHQASFIKTALLKEWKYDLQYKIGSDHDFFYRAYINRKKFQYFDQLVCLFDGRDGATKKQVIQGTRDMFNSALNHNFSIGKWLYSKYFLFYIRAILGAKKLLGNKLTDRINKFRRQKKLPLQPGNLNHTNPPPQQH
jgi:glycosyltransferase involved in cell wall biosynthesis